MLTPGLTPRPVPLTFTSNGSGPQSEDLGLVSLCKDSHPRMTSRSLCPDTEANKDGLTLGEAPGRRRKTAGRWQPSPVRAPTESRQGD